ncbi:MAG: hypothetical protein WAW73_14120 [Rhodoferax sp.]
MTQTNFPTPCAIDAGSWMRPWQTFEGWLWTVSYLAAVALGWFTPVDVLDQWPQAKEFTDFMASWNMQIRRVGEISGAANQANRFVYSVLWCVMPVAWGVVIRDFYAKKKHSDFVLVEKSWLRLWVGNLMLAVFAFLSISLVGDVDSRIGKAMFLVPISRALFAPLNVFIFGVLIIVLFYSLWAIASSRVSITGKSHGR